MANTAALSPRTRTLLMLTKANRAATPEQRKIMAGAKRRIKAAMGSEAFRLDIIGARIN